MTRIITRAHLAAAARLSRSVDALAKIGTRPVVWVPAAAMAVVATIYFHAWEWLEPLTGVATLAVAVVAMLQTRRHKEAYYDASNGDEKHVVALEVGRPISEAVKDRFGHLDILVRVQDVIGTSVLTTNDHYEAVARAVYSACARAQNKPIDLIVSGPNGLLFILGQMVGLDRFRISVWQYYNGEYQPVPRPTRDWLEHRG